MTARLAETYHRQHPSRRSTWSRMYRWCRLYRYQELSRQERPCFIQEEWSYIRNGPCACPGVLRHEE
ncbi:uncharacterized protein ARMOST_00220 [Armillaria ostoyae]|uniref:Uncharacterized protein n=1 Tax=Armillaria ostoyae TaxID=47428 RepID=A0A284QKI5_ARMOS|nr:uncharacterized protein ARMOST_00220 [Armillaria ostoyae]